MAYLASLTRLRENVRQELSRLQLCEDAHAVYLASVRLLEHLDADLREVRADVDQLIEEGEW